MLGGQTNDKMEGSGCVLTDVLSQQLYGETEENHKKPVQILSILVNVQNEHLPNTSLECYL
jgi:hypothetical protein